MRVAVVSLRTPSHVETGATRRLDERARLLAGRGHDVTVFCAQFWDGEDAERVVEGVRYRAVTTDPGARWLFALVVPVLVALADPDVVHAGSVPPAQVLAAKAGALVRRVPLVVEWYGDEPAEGRLGSLAGRVADAVVTPSRLVRTWVRERGVDGDAVAVVPDTVDLSLIESTDPAGDADVVYARELDGDANLESLLLALAELRERDWDCLVIGDGPERAAYERQAADLRIDDRVEFEGELSREERLARYRAAHVFVQTALRVPFPTELLWALACGCVGVVEYQVDSSAHELIEQRDRGLRTTDDRELTDAIVAAGGMDDLALDDSFQAYDAEAVLDEVVELYERLREEYGLV